MKTPRAISPEQSAALIERQAVRAILISPEHEVLLMRAVNPQTGERFWITPGGGIEAGETREVALRRELREELGLVHFEVGPLVWRRRHTFDWGDKRYLQHEEYYVVHVPRFDPRMSDALEILSFDRFHWWPVAELHQATECLTPLTLAQIVDRYLADGAPEEVPPVEILID